MGIKNYGRGHEEEGNEEVAGFSRDGKLVWKYTVDIGALPNASTKLTAHGLTITSVLDIEGVATDPVAGDTIVLTE